MAAEHQRGAERDKIAGHMGDEKTLQTDEGGGIDETAIERKQGCDRGGSA